MDSFKVRVLPGPIARPLVNSFYIEVSGKPVGNDLDTFFIAVANKKVIGSARLCIEYDTPILRSMMVQNKYKRKGVGRKILSEFKLYLDQKKLKNTFCLPYAHLENYYGLIGFKKISEQNLPDFLIKRLSEYRTRPGKFISMHRP